MSEDFDSHWVEMNNRTIREERIRTALNTAAWALAIICATLLGTFIFGWALANAATEAQIAPAILRF